MPGWQESLIACLFLLGFALLFILGGWGAVGEPPKPFAPAKGFFLSGFHLQLVGLGLWFLFVWRLGDKAHQGFEALLKLGAVALLLALLIFFVLTLARSFFGWSELPPSSWGVASRTETWWLEFALALNGLALTCAIPWGVVKGVHVSIDALSTLFDLKTRRKVQALGTAFLLLPSGLLIFAKGTDFAARAWQSFESSQSFGIEFVFVVKTLVPLLGFLILTAGMVLLSTRGSQRDL